MRIKERVKRELKKGKRVAIISRKKYFAAHGRTKGSKRFPRRVNRVESGVGGEEGGPGER